MGILVVLILVITLYGESQVLGEVEVEAQVHQEVIDPVDVLHHLELLDRVVSLLAEGVVGLGAPGPVFIFDRDDRGHLDHVAECALEHRALVVSVVRRAVSGIGQRLDIQPLIDLGLDVDGTAEALRIGVHDHTAHILVAETGIDGGAARILAERQGVVRDECRVHHFIHPVRVVFRGGDQQAVIIIFIVASRVLLVPEHFLHRSRQVRHGRAGVLVGHALDLHEFLGIQHVDPPGQDIDTGLGVEGDGSFSGFAGFCRDDHDAVRTFGTIDGRRGGIFQDVDAFDVVGVDHVGIDIHDTVQDIERVGRGVDGALTTDTDAHRSARTAGR